MDLEIKATLILISVIIVILAEVYKWYEKHEKKTNPTIINELTKDYFDEKFEKILLSLIHLKTSEEQRDKSPGRTIEREKRRSGLFHLKEESKDK